MEKCKGCGKLTDNTCSECGGTLCDSVGKGCICPCQIEKYGGQK